MKGRMYFTTKSQKEGRIMIKTHPCAQIFCCDSCGFEQVQCIMNYSELNEHCVNDSKQKKILNTFCKYKAHSLVY